MSDQKKPTSVAMTQLPTAPRVPLALDTSKFILGQRESLKAMQRINQAISRKMNSVDQAGHVPGVNSLLD